MLYIKAVYWYIRTLNKHHVRTVLVSLQYIRMYCILFMYVPYVRTVLFIKNWTMYGGQTGGQKPDVQRTYTGRTPTDNYHVARNINYVIGHGSWERYLKRNGAFELRKAANSAF